MADEHLLINKFNDGELSELVASRIDYKKRQGGAKKLENYIPLVQGPITSRAGTIHIGTLKDQTNKSHLIPFEYSVDQAYMIECSANVFRYYKNRALITRSVGTLTAASASITKSISSITIANPAVVTTSAIHGITVGRYVSFKSITSTVGTSWLNGKTFITTNNPTTSSFRFKRSFLDHGVTTDVATYGYVAATDGTVYTGGQMTLANHGLVTNDVILISGITGGGTLANALNGNYYRVIKVDANTFDLCNLDGSLLDTSSYGTTVTNGTVTWVGTWHPYSQTDLFPTATPNLFSVSYAQNTNTMFFANKSYPPLTLTRSGDSSWTISEYLTYDGPYLATNTSDTTLSEPAASGYIDATAVTGINSNQGFLQTDVGRHLRLDVKGTGTWYIVKIVAVSSATRAYYSMQDASNTGILGAMKHWRLGLWSDSTSYPSAVSFYQDRLCWGGTPNTPERIDTSRSGVYNWYSPTGPEDVASNAELRYRAGYNIADDSAMEVSMLSNDVNYIRWICGTEKALLVGTAASEWAVSAGSGAALTPTNIMATNPASYGCQKIQPVKVGTGVCYVQRSGRKVRYIANDFSAGGFVSSEKTIAAEHITDGNVCGLAFQKEPWPIIWAWKEDGGVICFLFDPEQEAEAWSKVILGGTNVVVESIATLIDPALDRYDVWFIVKRTVNGSTVRYVEYLGREWILDSDTPLMSQVCMDSAVVSSNASGMTTATAAHLPSTSVTVVADGVELTGLTTNGSGVVTLGGTYRYVNVGLPFVPKWHSMEVEGNASNKGPGIGAFKKMNKCIVKHYKSLYGTIGRDADHLDDLSEFDTLVISSITAANPGVITAGYSTGEYHGLQTDDIVVISGVVGNMGTSLLNGETYRVVYISETTFSLKTMAGVAVDTSGKTYTSGGSVIRIYSGYSVVDFPGDFNRNARICYEQSKPFPSTLESITIDLSTKV